MIPHIEYRGGPWDGKIERDLIGNGVQGAVLVEEGGIWQHRTFSYAVDVDERGALFLRFAGMHPLRTLP